jgi:hypothetical protein
MHNKSKYILTLNCLLSCIIGFCQSSDTIRIRKDVCTSLGYTSYRTKGEEKFARVKDLASYTASFFHKPSADSKQNTDSILDVLSYSLSKYFIFLSPDEKTVLEEGWYYGEYFSGAYKSYFENGKLKEEGYFTEECDSTFYPGQRKGDWNFYTRNGQLKETIRYTPKPYPKGLVGLRFSIPPCTCKQALLYTDKACTTTPPSKLRGTVFHYSSAPIFNEALSDPEINKESSYELRFLKMYAAEFMDSVFSQKACSNGCLFYIEILLHEVKDTSLRFSISYLEDYNEPFPHPRYFIMVKGQKVCVSMSEQSGSDSLLAQFETFAANENFRIFLTPDKKFQGEYNPPGVSYYYKGKYALHGNKITARFSYPYNLPEEREVD